MGAVFKMRHSGGNVRSYLAFLSALMLVPAWGIPASAVQWYTETVDSGYDMGLESDMALDSSGNPHIAYHDEVDGDLKYATRTDQGWSTYTVTSSGDTGSYPSIAIDSSGHPHIVFLYVTMSGISYAAFNGSSWTVRGLDWLNDVGPDSDIAVDSSNNPHFAYYYRTDGDLRYLTLNGMSWSSSTVDSAGDTGYFTSLALDSQQRPHVSYYNFDNGKLKYASWTGSSWVTEVVDSNGNTGWGTSLVIDSSDVPHISYGEYILNNVRYASKIGGNWQIETVARVYTYNHATGSELLLDSKGDPHLVMRSTTSQEMAYVSREGSSWKFVGLGNVRGIAVLDKYDVPYFEDYYMQTMRYLLPMPSAPRGVNAIERSPTSLKWGWSDVSDGLAAYRVLESSDAVPATGGLVAGTTYWAETGLSTNTAYGRKVEAFASFLSSASAPISVYTLAAPPAASSVAQVSSYSVTLSWEPNSNPGNTVYEVSRSTDNFSASFSTPVPYGLSYAGTSYSAEGLSPETTYYFRVRAYNGDGIPTAFDAVVSTATHPAVPSAAVIAPLSVGVSSAAINWSWDITPFASIVGLRVLASSGGALSGDLSPDATFYIQTGLSPNASSQVDIEAFNITGVSLSAPVVRYTLANPPVSAAVAEVAVTSASLCWGNNSNPAYTSYDLNVWEAGSSTTSVRVSSCCTAVAGLYAGTTYYFSVAAVNGDGVRSSATAVLSTVTPQVPYVGDISPGAPAVVSYQSPHGEVALYLARETFGEAVRLTAAAPGTFPPAVSRMGNLSGSGVGVEITLDQPVQPSKEVRLTISYRDSDVAGLDESRLALARYEPAGGIWVPLVSYPDPENNRVSAMVDHFSTYQIMQVTPSASVGAVKVAPNPLRPALGHTAMVFSNLPAFAVLRIYSLAGSLIREIHAGAGGIASWDGRNKSGVYVASGVYFVFAEKGGDKRTFKVAVQR